MKHLSPIRLTELADGLEAAAREAAHLQACPDCRAELAGLRALVHGLAAAPAPAPPKALHQATLQRLGLAPARPAAAPAWQRPWLWGPALAAGLAVAIVFPCLQTSPPAPSVQPGRCAAPKPVARPLPRCLQAQAPAAQPQAPLAAPMDRSVAVAPQSQAPAPVGAQPAEPAQPAKLDVRGDEPSLKPTPGVGLLSIGAVRNNLLRGGDRFSVVVQMGEAGPLDAVVLDARGRTQASLFHGPAGPGQLELQWDGAAPSGAYTVLIQLRGESQRVRVLVVH